MVAQAVQFFSHFLYSTKFLVVEVLAISNNRYHCREQYHAVPKEEAVILWQGNECTSRKEGQMVKKEKMRMWRGTEKEFKLITNFPDKNRVSRAFQSSRCCVLKKKIERPGPGVEPGLHRQHSKTARALPTCTNAADFTEYFPEVYHHR